MDDKSVVYRVYEVAEMLKVSIETVRRWIRSGKVKSIRLGRSHLIPKAEIDKLMNVDEKEAAG